MNKLALNKLIALADRLDSRGLHKEADQVDVLIKKISEDYDSDYKAHALSEITKLEHDLDNIKLWVGQLLESPFIGENSDCSVILNNVAGFLEKAVAELYSLHNIIDDKE